MADKPDDKPKTKAAAAPATGEDGRERIAKVMARAGLCSRRDAETWIEAGRVAVNGAVLSSPAVAVGPADRVLVDGRPLPAREPPRVWRYYKPQGLVTTRKDEGGRPTVFDALPAELPRLLSVGRLDLTSEGLLLLTNDGELARHLEMPSTGWIRRYRVRVHGRVDERQLASLSGGITVEGVRYQGIEAALDRQQGANAWLTIGLKEGKNREIRKVMEALGYSVSRLIRVSYGPFQLGHLREGEVEEVKASVLRDQVGSLLATLTKRTGNWVGSGTGSTPQRAPTEDKRPPRSIPARSKAAAAAAPERGQLADRADPPRRKSRVKPQPVEERASADREPARHTNRGRGASSRPQSGKPGRHADRRR